MQGFTPNAYLRGDVRDTQGTAIGGLEATCNGETLILSPPETFDWASAETRRLEARLLINVLDGDLNRVVVTDLVGNPIEEAVNWSFTVQRTASGRALAIALNEGWTWISLNRTLPDSTLGSVLASAPPDDGDLIKSQTALSLFDHDIGAWVGGLSTIEPGSAYLVKRSQAGTLLVEGPEVDPSTIPLTINPGQNWMGYLPHVSLPVNDALASLEATSGDEIKSQTQFARYDGERWMGSLTQMDPGRGYLLTSANAGTLIYPSGDALAAPARALTEEQATHSLSDVAPGPASANKAPTHKRRHAEVNEAQAAPHRPNEAQHNTEKLAEPAPMAELAINPETYTYSMTITGTVEVGDAVLPEDPDTRVWATVAGETRGTGRMQYVEALKTYRVFLMLHSDQAEGEPLTLHLYDAEQDRTFILENALAFKADAMLGTPSNPVVFAAETPQAKALAAAKAAELPEAFSLAQNYPNPFNPVTTINYELPEPVRVRLKVYDMLGREVYSVLDADQEAGRYDVRFDASRLASGIYFYRIEAGSFVQVRKMVLLR